MNYTVYTVLVAALFLSSAMASGKSSNSYMPSDTFNKGGEKTDPLPATKPASEVKSGPNYTNQLPSFDELRRQGPDDEEKALLAGKKKQVVPSTPEPASASQEPERVSTDWMMQIAHSVCVYRACVNDPKNGFTCKKTLYKPEYEYLDNSHRDYTSEDMRVLVRGSEKSLRQTETETKPEEQRDRPMLLPPPRGRSIMVGSHVSRGGGYRGNPGLPEIDIDGTGVTQSGPVDDKSQSKATVGTPATQNQPNTVAYRITMHPTFRVSSVTDTQTQKKTPELLRMEFTCSYPNENEQTLVKFVFKAGSDITSSRKTFCQQKKIEAACEEAYLACNGGTHTKVGIHHGCCSKARYDWCMKLTEDVQNDINGPCHSLQSLEAALIAEAGTQSTKAKAAAPKGAAFEDIQCKVENMPTDAQKKTN